MLIFYSVKKIFMIMIEVVIVKKYIFQIMKKFLDLNLLTGPTIQYI